MVKRLLIEDADIYSNPHIICEFLTPSPWKGEGWGGVKKLRLLQGLLY